LFGKKPKSIESVVIKQKEEPVKELIKPEPEPVKYNQRALDEIKFCKKNLETQKDRVIRMILRIRAQNASEKCDHKHKVRGY
jgi:hypothetical protein